MPSSQDALRLRRLYANRFTHDTAYRRKVWRILALYFGQWIPPTGTILDLGAGYCEFINNVAAGVKYAMDLNPDVHQKADSAVNVLQQDCAEPWPIGEDDLDVVFTSNFLEHLPNKQAVSHTLANAYKCLKPGGRFIAMGPNIKYVQGAYWDFFDHHVELTELSMSEALNEYGFRIEECVARFLPYSMVHRPKYPTALLRLYLDVPIVWKLFGKQFLVIAIK